MPLAADVSRFVEQARARLRQAPIDVVSAIAADLVMNTPVDKGVLRAGWNADGETAPDSGGTATIARLQDQAEAMPFGSVFTFANATFYGPFVEFGTVHMRPRAFTRATIARAPAIAAQVLAQGGFGAQP